MYNIWTDLSIYRSYFEWTELIDKYYNLKYGGCPKWKDSDDMSFEGTAYQYMGNPTVDRFIYEKLLDLGLIK